MPLFGLIHAYRVGDLPGRRTPQSTRLATTPVKLSTVGSKHLAVTAYHAWNILPNDVTCVRFLLTFQRLLERFLPAIHCDVALDISSLCDVFVSLAVSLGPL